MKAIVDCNSFYCSCEKVFRPDLAHKPVVVLSNNDGCIISRTDEARDLGIGMAGPFFLAKDVIEQNDVAVFSSNYNLYGDMSRRVMNILRELAGDNNVEVYSVDEAFLNLEAFEKADFNEMAAVIRDRIEKWTGVQVSVGIAPTKTLAKLANRIAKKNKLASNCVTVLDTPEKLVASLQNTKVGDLWGVGSRFAEKLNTLGICSAWDLYNISEEWARTHLGGVVGVRLIRELHGEEAIFMKGELDKKKMITTSRMFGNPVTSLSDIKEAIATYITRAAEKLRRQSSAAGVIQVFAVAKEEKFVRAEGGKGGFRHGATVSRYYILPSPTSATQELIKPAMAMAEHLYEAGRRYSKAGVILGGLVPDDCIQANLFSGASKPPTRFLMSMLDNINFSMRGDMVKFAATGTKRNWKMRQEYHSPRYTTRWEELYEVH